MCFKATRVVSHPLHVPGEAADGITVKEVLYPRCNPSRPFYDQCRTAKGGYGGLLSATFFSTAAAIAFFNNLDTAKGPSLGTNFTLR